jgi:hypothetical protein
MAAERSITIKVRLDGLDQLDRLKQSMQSLSSGAVQLSDSATKAGSTSTNSFSKMAETAKSADKATKEVTKSISALGDEIGSRMPSKYSAYANTIKTFGEHFQTLYDRLFKTKIATDAASRAQEGFTSAMGSFLSGGGKSFGDWLRSGITHLNQYKLTLAAVTAGFTAVGVASVMAARNTEHLVDQIIRTHSYRISKPEETKKWMMESLNTDWSAGIAERAGIYDALMAARIMNEQEARETTEAIETFFYANKERLEKQGYTQESFAKALLSSTDEQELRMLTGVYGMEKRTPVMRMQVVQDIVAKYDMDELVKQRPEEILRKRMAHLTQGIAVSLTPVLNTVLGAILKIGDVLGKIPGSKTFAAWTIVIGAATASLGLMAYVMATVIGGLNTMIKLVRSETVAHMARNVALRAYNVAAAAAAVASRVLGTTIASALVATGIGGLLILAGLLVGVAIKTGALQKAWEKFKSSAIGKDFFKALEWGQKVIEGLFSTVGDIFDSLDKAYSSGKFDKAISIAFKAGEIGGGAITFIAKTLLAIYDFIRRIYYKFEPVIKHLAKVVDMFAILWAHLKKFWGIFNAIKVAIDVLKNVIGFIPGFGKSIKGAELEALLEQARKRAPEQLRDLRWVENEYWSGYTGLVAYDKAGKPRQVRKVTQGELAAYVGWDQAREIYAKGKEYSETPSWLDMLKGIIPRVTIPGTEKPPSPSPVPSPDDYQPPSKEDRDKAKEDIKQDISNKYGNLAGKTFDLFYNWGSAMDTGDRIIPAQTGAEITRSGLVVAHSGEEIVPADVKKGTELAAEKLLKIVQGLAGGGGIPINAGGVPAGTAARGAGFSFGSAEETSRPTVIVNAPITVEVSQASSDRDINRLIETISSKLMFRLRNDLEHLQFRSIAYMRG